MDKKLSWLACFNACLNGLSQIMLQRNRGTGIIFLVALLIGNWIACVGAVVGVLVGTLTARICQFPSEKIVDGHYGFSSALVGIVLTTLFQLSSIVIIALVVGALFASLLQHFFYCSKVPAFTFPFVCCSWAIILLLHELDVPVAVSVISLIPAMQHYPLLHLLSNSFGQVLFQEQLFSGILILLGVFINAPIATIFALMAAGLAAWVSILLGLPIHPIEQGLLGFNVVLTALAMYGANKAELFWMSLGIVLTFVLHFLLYDSPMLRPFGGMLTFPFVLGTWLAYASKHQWGRNKR
ncbi:MAG: urea transporter [Bacteroidetes bacterium]|nr:urea transporter [Bacteroidota bacterium]